MDNFNDKLKRNFNIPNLLSSIRIVAIAPFIYYFLKDRYVMATVMLIVSGLSDLFDGFIARKFNQVTRLGAMLDPIADKLTLTAVVFCIGIKFTVVMPIVIILIIKELSMLVAGFFMIKNHKLPPMAKWYGKLATVIFYFSVSIIVALKAIWGIENKILTITLMCITAVAMLYSLLRYFLLFLDFCKYEVIGEKKNSEVIIAKQDIK